MPLGREVLIPGLNMFSLRRFREPVDIEDGVAYYPKWETTRAIREGERLARKASKLHRHRCRYPCDHPVYKVMDLPRFREEIEGVDEDVVDAIEHAINILSGGSELPSEWMDRPMGPRGRNRECHVGKGFWIIYHTDGDKLVLVALVQLDVPDGQSD